MEAASRIVLIGLSGTGKSTVAKLVADRLRWESVDIDDLIVADAGESIPEIFERQGEPAFRAIERRVLAAALARENVVVATGAGAVVDPATWDNDLLGAPGTLVVALDAAPETSLARLRRQEEANGGSVVRPMLAGGDPLARIVALKAERQAAYDRAAITLVVDEVPAGITADEVAHIVRGFGWAGGAEAPVVILDAPSGRSAIVVGAGLGERVGGLTRERWPAARRAWLISDDAVVRLHGEGVGESLRTSGFQVETLVVPVGEGSKSLAVAGTLYDRMLGGGVERGDLVVALGGGVVGDLAGFVAATCLRGLGLVQVPTSLLAMVDSSVGGKTGINHTAGKNLIGAFYQPPLVVVDPGFLRTLPLRETTSGWAEVVKHGLIQRSTPGGERNDLSRFLIRNRSSLLALREPAISYLIRRNIALKAAVVTADEREAGVRAFLNFGHTVGHAIEAAGYRLLHGEAIAVGMRAAARIGASLGTCDEATVAALEGVLDQYGLPRSAAAGRERVLALLGSDKKRAAGAIRWVLPRSGGGVCLRDDVPPAAVAAALDAVLLPGS